MKPNPEVLHLRMNRFRDVLARSGSATTGEDDIQPGLIASFPVGKRLEITPSAKALIPIHSDPYNEYDTLMAVNLGLGYFATADRSLVIRPEIGFLFKPGESGSYMQFGIGVSYCTKPKT